MREKLIFFLFLFLFLCVNVGWANKMRVLLVVILTTLSLVATAQERIALIIGNADYETAPLITTINDASEMASALSNLGFSVAHLADANHEQMLQAIEEFGDKLHEDSVGLFYYAGHAAQIKDNNYLVPINNGHIDSSFKLRSSSVTSQSIQELMVESGSKVNFIFLDSCRNIPSWDAIKGLEEGLAKTEGIESEDEAQFFDEDDNDTTRGVTIKAAPQTKKIKTAKGMLISFSTNPGNTASDGSGNHSPYTKHLLEQINKPNLQVEMMLKAVQAGVEDETNGQIPWYESSIIGSFCFNVVKDGCAKTIVVGIPFLEGVENIEQVELEDGSSYVGQIIGSNTPQGKGVMTLINGNQIEGEWHNGDISQGKITTADDATYEGGIQNKQMHGQGVLTSAEVGRYEGEFKNGLKDGQGEQAQAGNEYKGEFKDDERSGQGVLIWPSGMRYEGEFKDGERNGQGIEAYPDGERYEGEWKDGKRNGQGIEAYPDGQRYEGEWQNGMRNGEGVMTYVDGGRYEGEWKNDSPNGQGVATYVDGGRYEGEWQYGMKHGQGIATYPDGQRYEGEWQDGMKHGQGIATYPDGASYVGSFKNGRFDGQGVVTLSGGARWEGEHKGGVPHGFIIYTTPSGTRKQEVWENGIQISSKYLTRI